DDVLEDQPRVARPVPEEKLDIALANAVVRRQGLLPLVGRNLAGASVDTVLALELRQQEVERALALRGLGDPRLAVAAAADVVGQDGPPARLEEAGQDGSGVGALERIIDQSQKQAVTPRFVVVAGVEDRLGATEGGHPHDLEHAWR